MRVTHRYTPAAHMVLRRGLVDLGGDASSIASKETDPSTSHAGCKHDRQPPRPAATLDSRSKCTIVAARMVSTPLSQLGVCTHSLLTHCHLVDGRFCCRSVISNPLPETVEFLGALAADYKLPSDKQIVGTIHSSSAYTSGVCKHQYSTQVHVGCIASLRN